MQSEPFVRHVILLLYCFCFNVTLLLGQQDSSIQLTAGTTIILYLIEEIDSQNNQLGQSIELLVKSSIYQNGVEIVAKDAIATGIVTSVEKACQGRCGFHESHLEIKAESVLAVDGQTIDLRGIPLKRSGDGYNHNEAQIKFGTTLKGRVLNNYSIDLSNK